MLKKLALETHGGGELTHGGGGTRDFLKNMAKKDPFSQFFGEGSTFSGSRGQVKYDI